MPYKKFAKLQEEFFAVSKQMRDTKNPEEKMKLLKDLQVILKKSQRVLEEIHKKQANQGHQVYSCRTTVRRDLLILIPPLYSMKPSLLNLFMNKFTRERVVPIISASVS